MPELSRFYNIVVTMYFADDEQHHKPHIHVRYNEFKASIGIDGTLLAGSLPQNEMRLVTQWLVLHEAELYKAWNDAVRQLPIEKIPPLD